MRYDFSSVNALNRAGKVKRGIKMSNVVSERDTKSQRPRTEDATGGRWTTPADKEEDNDEDGPKGRD